MSGRRSWSLEEIVAEIRQLHAGGVALTYAGARAAGFGHLVTAAERYAGSWGKAIKLAGVDAPVRFLWTADIVLAEARRLAAEGTDMSSQHLGSTGHNGLVAAGRKFFGSWPEARTAAGVEYRRPGSRTWEEIREALRDAHARGIKMSVSGLGAAGLAAVAAAAQVHAGGWNVALREAGIPVVMEYERWSRAEVLERIRARHRAGDSIAYRDLIEQGERKLMKAGVRYFGTWVAACQAALPSYRPAMTTWDEDRLLAELAHRHRSGACMRSTEVAKEDQALVAAAHRLGIPWREACRRAGVPARALASPPAGRRTRWSEALILGTLLAAAESGVPLTVASFRGGFISAVYRRFETWEAAVRAAGLAGEHWRDRREAAGARLSRPRPRRGRW